MSATHNDFWARAVCLHRSHRLSIIIPSSSRGCSKSGKLLLSLKWPDSLILLLSTITRFNPKEDVSSSTSLKSSVQRHIRTSLLAQYAFLSETVWRDASISAATPNPVTVDDEDERVKDDVAKGGKKKGGKGKSGKGKVKEEKEEGGEEGEGEGREEVTMMTVLDDVWPKKEGLGLTKWYVQFNL